MSSTGVTITDPHTTRRAVLAAALGNATEWYDFGIFSYLAVIIGKVFYPDASPGVQLIASFTTFAAAFLVRPIGGLVLGPLGDRIGRRSVLALTMIMMAVGTAAIGVLPTAAAVGVLAPILLLVCRMVQGFSTGGEYGGATTFIAEYAPDKRRGFLGSWLEFGTLSGYIGGAAIVTLLTLGLGEATMLDWGWRIPFLLALPLGAVGLYLRIHLDETPAFEVATSGTGRAPKESILRQFKETLVDQWRPLLLCVGLVLAFNVNNYMLTAYLPTYLETVLDYSESQALVLSLVAMAAMLASVTLFGRLSDAVGRRRVLLSGSICSIVVAFPAFWLMQNAGMVGVIAGSLLMALALVHFSGAAPSTLPALFPTKVRYGALAIGFNVSVSLFGGTTPLVAETLVQTTGNAYMPAVQLVLAGIVGAVTAVAMKETANQPLLGALPAVVREKATPPEPPSLGAQPA